MKHPTQTPVQGSNKRLWAALLVGVVLLLAMGAALIRIQSLPIEPRLVVLPQPTPGPVAQATPGGTTTATASAPAPPDAPTATGSAGTTTPAVPRTQASNIPSTLSHQAQAAADNAATQAIQITAKPRPVLPGTPEPAVARPPAAGASATARPEAP